MAATLPDGTLPLPADIGFCAARSMEVIDAIRRKGLSFDETVKLIVACGPEEDMTVDDVHLMFAVALALAAKGV